MPSPSPHPVSLRQLQYVVAVAELCSFRRAAERCRVAQPSLSAQVAAAEDALGVQLFERDSHGVRVTLAGEALVVRARRVLREADDLVDASRRLQDPLAGTLRVGVIPPAASGTSTTGATKTPPSMASGPASATSPTRKRPPGVPNSG